VRVDQTAIEALEHTLLYKTYWCEHNVSATIYVKEHEWLDVGAWVYKHMDEICGLSFLPYSDHIYKQAPYQEITKEQYNEAVKTFPKIDWNKFNWFETEDTTTSSHELACTSGVCEL
jgi:ribonucleoside-diphosphate reductase alpha chain